MPEKQSPDLAAKTKKNSLIARNAPRARQSIRLHGLQGLITCQEINKIIQITIAPVGREPIVACKHTTFLKTSHISTGMSRIAIA
jgi:hypothetical protein